jgi:hypothetical protein
MAIFHQPPGPWFSFTKRPDNQNLSINELKSKFYKEQLLFENFVSSQVSQQYLQNNSAQLNNQLHQAGKRYNEQKLLSAVFNPLNNKIQTISGGETQILITLQEPVTVNTGSGVPFIDVNNNQLGGGSASTIRYTYYESTGLQMRFAFDLPASPNNSGTVAANVIAANTSLVGAITSNTLTGMTGAVNSNNVTFTAAQGTGGTGFQDAITDVRTNGAGDGLDTITFKSSASPATYSPGQTLTSTAGNIFDGTGAITLTIDSNILTVDTLSMAGTAINLNGATVVNTGDGKTTDLTYISTSTRESFPN